MSFFPLAAWCGHTEVSREICANLETARKSHGMKHDELAEILRLDSKDLGKQLAGQKPLNLLRMGYLAVAAPKVYLTWLSLEVKRMGGTVLTAEDRALLIGAATAGPKRMAAMVPELSEERRRA